jgi:hypothetical protein
MCIINLFIVYCIYMRQKKEKKEFFLNIYFWLILVVFGRNTADLANDLYLNVPSLAQDGLLLLLLLLFVNVGVIVFVIFVIC